MSSRHPTPLRQRPISIPENNNINEEWLDQFVDEYENSEFEDGVEDEDMTIVTQTTTPEAISQRQDKYSKQTKAKVPRRQFSPTRMPVPTVTERTRRQGTREQVWNGIAERTKGGLVKEDLLSVPMGIDKSTGETVYKLVSKKRSEHAKKVFGYAGVRN